MHNSVPLDPSMLDLVGHLAWRPPSVVREAALLSEKAEAFRVSQLAQIESSERELEKWITIGRAKRDRFWQVILGKSASRRSLAHLTNLVDAFERNQIEYADDLSRLRKALQLDQRQAEAISEAAAQVLQETNTRYLQMRERELRERLDFSLFLRACRAELDPDAPSGPAFDDPAELESYLLSVVAN